MTITVSPQIRLVAILGGVAALGLAAFMLTAGRSSSGSTAASIGTIKPLHPVRKLGTHGTVRKPVAKAKPHVKPAVAPKPVAKPKPAAARVALLPGLPAPLARALRKHELVVMALFDPHARVDAITVAEASAGAEVAHAGFVPLDVLNQRDAGPLVKQLGVLPDPAVLVYQRPGKLVARFDGFADRDTVAQAVTNGAPAELARQAAEQAASKAPAPPAHISLRAWAARASTICQRTEAGAQKIDANATDAEFLAWAPTMLATQAELLRKLDALPLPSATRDRALAQRFLAAADREHAFEKRVYVAVKRDGKARARRLLPSGELIVAKANAAANASGATGCAIYGQ